MIDQILVLEDRKCGVTLDAAATLPSLSRTTQSNSAAVELQENIR